MPLDINLFRAYAGGNPDLLKASQKKRFKPESTIDDIIAKDEQWRHCTGAIDDLKAERNRIQKKVGEKMKAKEECSEMVAQIKAKGEEIAAVEEKQKVLKAEVDSMLNKIGNIVAADVPVGNDEEDKHSGNRVERTWGTRRSPEGLSNHHDLLWRIGGYEPERGSQVAGHRGYFLRGPGVALNQAFQAYGVAFLAKRGYTALQPPYFMKKDVMAGVAQLEEFDEALYKVTGAGEDYYLIATSEQPICAYHKDEWVREDSLPYKYAGVSTCFRKEAGSHGKDTWGIFRVHQFEKIEQFVVTEGNLEVSSKAQEEMIASAEEFYQSLGFPYQVINIVSGALNNAAIKKYDLECWFPGYNAYRELVSCSNCTDYQSRSMEIRCGQKKLGEREKKYVHMLNSTLCATGRAICCLLETYQEADGVRIPEVLVPFMGGVTFLPFVRESKLEETAGAPKPAKAPAAAPAAAAPAAAAAASAPKAAPAAAPAPAPAAAPAPAPAPAEGSVAALVASKAEEVRKLKADKADKDVIAKAVDELKALKLQDAGESGAAGGAADDKKKEKKEKKAAPAPEAVKVDPASLPPAVPVLAPAYTTAAPTRASASATVQSRMLTAGKLDLAKLDTVLVDYSYVGGYLPSKRDADVLGEVRGLDFAAFPNVVRWYKNVTSFPADAAAAWV